MSGAAEAGTNWAAWLAAYAAAVATFVALRQMFLEQPSIRVVLYPNHEIPGHSPMTALVITNVGGRPLTIDFVAVLFRDRPMGVPIESWKREIPFRLAEGEYKVLEVNPKDKIPDDVRYVARDTADRWWPRKRRPLVWMEKVRWWRRRRKEGLPKVRR